ncbi:carbohydrate sulfotransferase 15-like [Watersipora subatra]|uniref:carbohydrate sulfotransferase 15-like n=1 Tax=Watersipora subatra TaxID=2589382 RepID=UPI00355C0C0B
MGVGSGRIMEDILAHSMYVVYIKEAFKFIPREQFMFRTSEEYNARTVDMIKQMDKEFFRIEFRPIPPVFMKKIKQTGKKNAVWNSTLAALDNFYRPYNEELAKLLQDDQWLFDSDRKYY